MGGCNESEHHRARLGDGVEQEEQASAILQKCLREANGTGQKLVFRQLRRELTSAAMRDDLASCTTQDGKVATHA